jgi:hypothetical protein
LPREPHFDERRQDIVDHAPAEETARRPWQKPTVVAAGAASAEGIGLNPGDPLGGTNLC